MNLLLRRVEAEMLPKGVRQHLFFLSLVCGVGGSLDDLISTLDVALSQRDGVLKVNERAESLGDSFP